MSGRKARKHSCLAATSSPSPRHSCQISRDRAEWPSSKLDSSRMGSVSNRVTHLLKHVLIDQLPDLRRGGRLCPVLRGKQHNTACVAAAIVVLGALLVLAKELDGWVATDPKLSATSLVGSAEGRGRNRHESMILPKFGSACNDCIGFLPTSQWQRA